MRLGRIRGPVSIFIKGHFVALCAIRAWRTAFLIPGASRKNTYTLGGLACDDEIEEAWYRFTGAAGSKMPESPPNKNTCGTHAPGWLNGRHPSVAEGKVH